MIEIIITTLTVLAGIWLAVGVAWLRGRRRGGGVLPRRPIPRPAFCQNPPEPVGQRPDPPPAPPVPRGTVKLVAVSPPEAHSCVVWFQES